MKEETHAYFRPTSFSHNHGPMTIMYLSSYFWVWVFIEVILFPLRVCVFVYNKSTCYLSILLAVRWLHQEEPHSNLIEKTVFHSERRDLELKAMTDWDFQQERQRTKETCSFCWTWWPEYTMTEHFTNHQKSVCFPATSAVRWEPGHKFWPMECA